MSIPVDRRYLSPIPAPSRPLPVFVLADISGSMGEFRKIETLNDCMTTMIRSFAAEDTARGDIQIGVVTFGTIAGSMLPFILRMFRAERARAIRVTATTSGS